MRFKSFMYATIAALSLSLSHAALANTPALTISGGSSTVGHGGNSSTTMGWRFDVGSSITVSALGYYDDLGNGLSESHDVGIFDAAGVLFVFTSVSSGTSGTLVDSFRYTSIAPFVLAPGAYTIGGTIGADATDPAIYLANDPITIADISIPAASSRYTEAGSYIALTYPDLNWPPANLYLGPNFQISSIPEPAGATLLICGLLVLLPRVGKLSVLASRASRA